MHMVPKPLPPVASCEWQMSAPKARKGKRHKRIVYDTLELSFILLYQPTDFIRFSLITTNTE